MTCSCGNTNPHQVARRRTADGATIALWSTGAVTSGLGCGLDGVPMASARTDAARRANLAAGWMLLGEVCLYDSDEVAPLYNACRWAARRGLGIGAARERLRRLSDSKVRPHWEVYHADRDGRPTLRVWRLPRIMWPGLVVWDRCSGAQRYELMNMDRDGVCVTTGIRFSTQAALATHLSEVRVLNAREAS